MMEVAGFSEVSLRVYQTVTIRGTGLQASSVTVHILLFAFPFIFVC
jgi:hypothetical protein